MEVNSFYVPQLHHGLMESTLFLVKSYLGWTLLLLLSKWGVSRVGRGFLFLFRTRDSFDECKNDTV